MTKGRNTVALPHSKRWLESIKKYAFSIKPVKVSQKVDETILTVKMTDDFPGSPCRHVFALVNEL